MVFDPSTRLETLDVSQPIWDRFFTVAPLVLVGTMEENGEVDLAPKHMAFPMGWDNYFGFVCTPRHRTLQNAQRAGVFTVSYPRPSQLVLTSLAASPRCEADSKPIVSMLKTFPATTVDGVLVEDGYLFFECELERVVDGFGVNSLVTGRIVAAHVHQDALRGIDRDDAELLMQAPMLGYLYPGRFAVIDQTQAFPFPAGMQR
jgi:flavin reductase (DIM6/NTAB) family NADH-FMN oxidoreductase RutF